VQVLVDGRVAPTLHRVFALGAESRPRTTIGRRSSAYSFLRWENWCAGTGAISLRITLGRRTVVRALHATSTPACGSHSAPSTLGVSLFVRR